MRLSSRRAPFWFLLACIFIIPVYELAGAVLKNDSLANAPHLHAQAQFVELPVTAAIDRADPRSLLDLPNLPEEIANPQTAAGAGYRITTSLTDPSCDTGYGGYVDLEHYGIYTQAEVDGNNKAFLFFDRSPTGLNFYGNRYVGMWVTDDGFVVFGAENYSGSPGQAQLIPEDSRPNNVAAMLWQDMEIEYDHGRNWGVSAATDEDVKVIIEYDDVHLVGQPNQRYDFEIVIQRRIDNRPGKYEIVYAYDNLQGTVNGPLTIGVENAAGSEGATVANAAGAPILRDSLMICLDYTENAPSPTPAPTPSPTETPAYGLRATDHTFLPVVQGIR